MSCNVAMALTGYCTHIAYPLNGHVGHFFNTCRYFHSMPLAALCAHPVSGHRHFFRHRITAAICNFFLCLCLIAIFFCCFFYVVIAYYCHCGGAQFCRAGGHPIRVPPAWL